MSRNWYHQLTGWYFRSSKDRRPAGRRRRPTFRPRIETMEDRLVPHTHTWTGQVSNDWLNNSNWIGGSPHNDNELPDVIFPASGVVNKSPNITNIFFEQVNSITFQGSGYTLTGVPLILKGQTVISDTATSGSNTIGNAIDLESVFINPPGFWLGDHIFDIAGGGTLNLNGQLYLAANGSSTLNFLYKQGAGTLLLANGSNNYKAGTEINAGHLALGADNTIPATSSVSVAAGAFLDFNNHIDHIGDLSGAGTVNLGNGCLFTGGDGATTTFSGSITGGLGDLYKQGNGTFTLTGANTYADGTHVLAGTLQVDGSLSSPTSVSGGATLSGTGTVGPVNVAANGTINPGDSLPGALRTGNLALPAGAVFEVRLKDTATYGQAAAGGSVDLTGHPTLNPQALAGFNPSVGDIFTILTSTGNINGIFNGLANNATLTINGQLFQITYLPHSAILKRVAPDQPLTATALTVTGGEAASFAGVVATFTDPDPLATTAGFAATIDWGGGPLAGTIMKMGTTFEVYGISPGYGEEGTYAITVTITDIDTSHDLGGSTAVAHSSIHVLDSALIGNGIPLYATEGQAFTNQPLAYCVDTGGAEALASYTVTIHWNDGTADSAGTLSVVNGMFQVSGSHTYAEEGAYTVTITVHDEGGSMVSVTTTANVLDAGLVVSAAGFSATEGVAVSPTVATFTDTGGAEPPANYTATIYWGDKSPVVAGAVMFNNGTFSVSGSHTYSEEGIYTVVVTVQDAGFVYTVYQTDMVADAALSANGVNVTATEGSAFTNALVATFTDADPQATASDYTATIDWGDSHVSAAIIMQNGSVFEVHGDHTYAGDGTYPIHVAIQDVGGSSAMAGSTATVADAPLVGTGLGFTATAGVPLMSIPVAAFLDLGGAEPPANYTATIDWGDNSGLDTSQVVGGPLFQVVGNHTYTLAGTLTVTVTIQDAGGSSVTVMAPVTVNPGPADHLAVTAPATVTANTPFDVTVTVQDAFNNTVTSYDRTVAFTTTDPDPNVVVPADYPFNPATDQGSHTFNGGVTLVTPGAQTITVTDTINNALTGSTTVTVMPGPSNSGPKELATAIRSALAAATPVGAALPAQSGQGSDPHGAVRVDEGRQPAQMAWRPFVPVAAPGPIPLTDLFFTLEPGRRIDVVWLDDLGPSWPAI